MEKPVKPRQVVIAGRIMWSLWVLGGATLLLRLFAVGAPLQQRVVLVWAVMFLITLSLLALLIRFVVKGVNWARIVYALMASVAVGVIALGLIRMPQFSPVGVAISVALIVAYSAAVGLLFHPASTAWFRRDARLE